MLNQPSSPDLERIAELARALGHPKRLAILDLLMQGVQCNCEIAAQLGLADNLISHHMRALQEVGLVSSERDAEDARWIYYSIDPAAVQSVMEALGQLLDTQRIQPRSVDCGPQTSDAGHCCG